MFNYDEYFCFVIVMLFLCNEMFIKVLLIVINNSRIVMYIMLIN